MILWVCYVLSQMSSRVEFNLLIFHCQINFLLNFILLNHCAQIVLTIIEFLYEIYYYSTFYLIFLQYIHKYIFSQKQVNIFN